MSRWALTQADRELLSRYIEPVMPSRVFDCRAQLFRERYLSAQERMSFLDRNPKTLGIAEYRSYLQWLFPDDRLAGALFSGLAYGGQRQDNNEYVATEIAVARAAGFLACGQLLVAPTDSADDIGHLVLAGRFVGLTTHRPSDAIGAPTPIADTLSRPQIALAEELGLTVTVSAGLSGSSVRTEDLETMGSWCRDHPRAKFVLTRAGGGPVGRVIEDLAHLRDIPNLWFDTSLVTDSRSVESILGFFGAERILYGSGFPISHFRGELLPFIEPSCPLTPPPTSSTVQPASILHGVLALAGLLSLLTRLSLPRNDIDAIFYRNAADLFDLP